MSEYTQQAIDKIDKDYSHGMYGAKESAMKKAVRDTLVEFCRQDEEFAQAVVQGGEFAQCMKAVANGVGSSISDLEVYRKAVQFYFPGAEIRMEMNIDLEGAVRKDGYEPKHAAPGRPEGIVLDFTKFL